MFQSTPVITDERTISQCDNCQSCTMFQSTPVITDERTQGLAQSPR